MPSESRRFSKQPEERNGIGAAGDTHADTVAGHDHARAANGIQELAFKLGFHFVREDILAMQGLF